MKKILMIVMILAVSLTAFGKEKIKIGYFDNAPHIFLQNNKTTGVLVDYWEKEIAPKMDVEIEWVGPLPPARLFAMMKAGEINAIALLSKNPEREKLYDYPDFQFQNVNPGIALLKEKNISKIDSLESLSGLEITFFKDGFISDKMKQANIKWDFLAAVSWKTQGLEKALVKRVDGVYDPDITTLVYVINKDAKYSKSLIALKLPNLESKNFSVFSKLDNGKFLKLYNQAIKSDDTKYEKLLEAFLNK